MAIFRLAGTAARRLAQTNTARLDSTVASGSSTHHVTLVIGSPQPNAWAATAPRTTT